MTTLPPAPFADDMKTQGCWALRRTGTVLTRFQVMGERASGTNVLRKTIQRNCKIDHTDGLGWKHGFPTMLAIPSNLLVVCAVRNAVDWALSMHKRPWHAHPSLQALSFSDFLRAGWSSVVDRPTDFAQLDPSLDVAGEVLQLDRHPVTGTPFESLIDLRRVKLDALLGLLNRDCSVALVRLEHFQHDPVAVTGRLRTAFDLPAAHDTYRPVTRRMGHRFKHSVSDRPATPDAITQADRDFILSRLNLKTEAALGYTY